MVLSLTITQPTCSLVADDSSAYTSAAFIWAFTYFCFIEVSTHLHTTARRKKLSEQVQDDKWNIIWLEFIRKHEERYESFVQKAGVSPWQTLWHPPTHWLAVLHQEFVCWKGIVDSLPQIFHECEVFADASLE